MSGRPRLCNYSQAGPVHLDGQRWQLCSGRKWDGTPRANMPGDVLQAGKARTWEAPERQRGSAREPGRRKGGREVRAGTGAEQTGSAAARRAVQKGVTPVLTCDANSLAARRYAGEAHEIMELYRC